MTTSRVASAGSTNAVLGRTAVPLSQLWQVPVFLAGIVALAAVAAASALAPSEGEDPVDHELAVVRRALAKPGLPSEHIVALAESAVSHAGRDPERVGEAHFLLGAIYLRRAERKSPDKGRDERDKAAIHLELAELRGVPEADRARLTYLRGKVIYLSGGDIQRAIELLSQSLPGGTDNPTEGYGILVEAQLQKPVPDLDAALDANLKQLEVCDDETILNQARLLRGELLLKKELRVEAIKALEAIGPKSPAKVRFKARYLQAKAAMEEGMWGRAIPWWNELLAHADVVAGGQARIFYNLGVCCINFEPPAHEKEAVAAWREAQRFGGEEAQAAAIRLAELRLHSGADAAAALDYFKDALDKVGTGGDYKNSLLDLSKTRALLEDACRIFDKQRDHEHFLQAAELYKKVATPGAAEEKIGQAAEARGRELLQQAEEPGADRGGWIVKAQDALQKAALAYEQAAETRPPAGRLDALWRCIECYRLAEKPEQAIAVLKKFVEMPAQPERKAQAWFTLAQMQRLLKLADARASYQQCVAFNVDAFTSRALLQLADIFVEAHELADAEAVLLQVKNPPSGPIADRAAHELALLKLANLYFQERKFDKAAMECKELMKQYPAHPSLLSVREQLAECYLNLAVQAQDNAKGLDVPLTLKQHHQQEWLQNLEAARDTYQELADDLDAKADSPGTKAGGKALSPAEDTLLRRALFKAADCYFELPNWFEEAFKRYTKLFERYRAEPEALWACYRICLCREWALKAKHADAVYVQDTAEASVEWCLHHFEEYEKTGAFRTPEEKATWQDYLLRSWNELQRTSKRRGG